MNHSILNCRWSAPIIQLFNAKPRLVVWSILFFASCYIVFPIKSSQIDKHSYLSCALRDEWCISFYAHYFFLIHWHHCLRHISHKKQMFNITSHVSQPMRAPGRRTETPWMWRYISRHNHTSMVCDSLIIFIGLWNSIRKMVCASIIVCEMK